MLKRPTPDSGAFFKLHRLLEKRKSKRSVRFGVIVFGLLEKPEDYNGFPLHGIFWLCDTFETYDEATQLRDEIMSQTGMTHVKILPLGNSDLLTIGVDPNKTQIVTDDVTEHLERQNVREHFREKEDEIRMNKIIDEERFQLTDPQSIVYYGHIWMKYIQNRTIREQSEENIKDYLRIEEERLIELRKLQSVNPEYETTWLSVFAKYRNELDEKSAAEQIKNYWLQCRHEVFPNIWNL